MKNDVLVGEWTLDDLKVNQNWFLELDTGDKEDLINATKSALSSNKDVFDLTIKDFPLSKFIEKINQAKEQVEIGLGFVIFRGLPIETFSEKEVSVMLWGIGQYIGYPETQDKAGSLLHVVTDTGASFKKSDNLRGFQTNEELTFHTDGADVFALLCLRNAKSGGLSKLVSSVAVFNEIEKTRPDLANVLQENFYFDARAQNQNEEKCQKIPVFVKHDNLVSALYKRRYIDSAQRFSEIPKLTEKQKEALDLIDKLCSSEKFCLSMQLKPGDLEIASNATTFHSRETYEDYSEPSKKRCMLRLWLSLFKPRPLPEVYRNTREWGPTFKRRGLN
jgi:alpha-ketoglutarate-dependent taurine dioxygenase|tara:strand:- start:54 stop:1052 length:999 start_codon:yes stop_codon:yes gene_type:complete